MSSTPELTPEEIARLTELESKATKGPWVITTREQEHMDGPPSTVTVIHGEGVGYYVVYDDWHGAMPDEDIAFICAARTAVPALLRDLARAREENAELRQAGQDLAITKAEHLVAALAREGGSVCVHCGEKVPGDTPNHWESCEAHPAFAKLAKLQAVAEAARERLYAYSDADMGGYCSPSWRTLRYALAAMAEKEEPDAEG